MRHVYVAADQDGRHKIGVTNNPQARRQQLSRDLGGTAVDMVRIEPHRDDAFDVERRAHATLAAHHEGGEWFQVDQATAINALEAALRETSAPVTRNDGRKLSNGGRPRFLSEPRMASFTCDGEMREAIEEWRRKQSPIPGKSEAMRRLIEAGLSHLDQPSAQ